MLFLSRGLWRKHRLYDSACYMVADTRTSPVLHGKTRGILTPALIRRHSRRNMKNSFNMGNRARTKYVCFYALLSRGYFKGKISKHPENSKQLSLDIL